MMRTKFLIYGLIFFLSIFFVSATYCYQESANVSNQTGIDGNCGLNYNGSILLRTSGENNFIVNYTLPNLLIAGARSMLRYSIFTINQSIPPNCLNLNGVLSLRFLSNNINSGVRIDCFNGSDYDPIYFYGSGFSFISSGESHLPTELVDGNWFIGDQWWGSVWENSSAGDNTNYIQEEAVWWLMRGTENMSISPSNVSFGQPTYFNISASGFNSSDFVNLSITFPNGSVKVFNTTTLDNVSWVSQNFTVVNGTYVVNASSPYNNLSQSFFVNNSQTVSPLSYAQTVAQGQNFSLNVSINSNTTVSINYSVACNIPNANLTCTVISPQQITSSGSFLVNINTSVVIPVGTYLGNISINRSLDGFVNIINLTLGISNATGKPVIVNVSNPYSISMYSNAVVVQSYNLTNNGTFNLSNCVASLDNSFVGWSFYSFSNISNLGINSSVFFNVTFSSPPVGSFAGFLQIICNATQNGLLNSLDSSNRPLITLAVSSPPVSPPGGGGGTPTIISSSGNGSFSFELDTGGSKAFPLMYPGQKRTFILILINDLSSDVSYSLTCQGSCDLVTLDSSTVKLSGLGSTSIPVIVSLPSTVSGDVSFVVDATSVSASREVDFTVSVSRSASFLYKYSPVVSDGDPGFAFRVNGVPIPKILIFLVVWFVVYALTRVLLPSKDLRVRNLRLSIYIIAFFGVFLLGGLLW